MLIRYVLFLIVFYIYVFPAVAAAYMLHRNKTLIFILNMFLGWTGVGWLIALLWALSGNTLNKTKGKNHVH